MTLDKDMSKSIPLSNGSIVLVDDTDFDSVNQYTWTFTKKGYAARHIKREDGKTRAYVQMHRELLGVPSNVFVQHINENKLDNRRENLRLTSHRKQQWLVGQVFNNWLVVRSAEEKKTREHYGWHVECTNCKNSMVKTKFQMKLGCRNCSLMPKGQTGLNKLCDRYRRNAESRKREFSLTIDEFRAITSRDCYYCGRSPMLTCVGWENKNRISTWSDYLYNGVDRISSDKGYTPENCVACCSQCNYAKSDTPQLEFVSYLRALVKNHSEGKTGWNTA